MDLATSRPGRIARQFRRRALALAGIAASLGIVVAGIMDPVTTREGAILLGVSASIVASLIVAAIALERNEFAAGLLELGIDQVFKDRLHDIPDDLWTDLLGGVRRHFCVLGMANHGYLKSDVQKDETKKALGKALGRKKVTVEFLWLNPDTQVSILREQEEGERGLRRDTCAAIVFFAEVASTLPAEQAARLSLREYNSIPTCGITWADSQLIVTHYLAAELNLRAPGVVLDTTQPVLERAWAQIQRREPRIPPLAKAYINNYREVASETWSNIITPERVEELRALRDELTETQKDKRSEAEIREDPTEGAEDG